MALLKDLVDGDQSLESLNFISKDGLPGLQSASGLASISYGEGSSRVLLYPIMRFSMVASLKHASSCGRLSRER